MKGVGIAIKELFAIVLFGGFCLFSDMARAEVTCDEKKFDIDKVVDFRNQGANKDKLHAYVSRVPDLTEERKSDINVMIEEAYAAKNIDEWKIKALGDCGSI